MHSFIQLSVQLLLAMALLLQRMVSSKHDAMLSLAIEQKGAVSIHNVLSETLLENVLVNYIFDNLPIGEKKL